MLRFFFNGYSLTRLEDTTYVLVNEQEKCFRYVLRVNIYAFNVEQFRLHIVFIISELINKLYLHNPEVVHKKLQDVFKSLNKLSNKGDTNIPWVLHAVSEHHPEVCLSIYTYLLFIYLKIKIKSMQRPGTEAPKREKTKITNSQNNKENIWKLGTNFPPVSAPGDGLSFWRSYGQTSEQLFP